jgi:carbonic anhydrase
MAEQRFGTVINCMDGRVQLPVNEYLRAKYGLDCVDTVTEAGPVAVLSEENDSGAAESIRSRVEISVLKHGSGLVAVVAHHDCAGNPVDEARQLEHLRSAVRTVQSWAFDVEVKGLWVDDTWTVQEIV